MIKFGSLQRDYDFYVSSDPAFIRPPAIPADGASDEDRASFKKAAEEYIAKWKSARETGDYSPLLVSPDAQPCKFVLGRISRNVWRAVQDRAGLPAESPRHIGYIALMGLLARLSLRSIPSSDLKIKHEPAAEWDDWPMAQASVLDVLDESDPSIVGEIGNEVLRRIATARGDIPS